MHGEAIQFGYGFWSLVNGRALWHELARGYWF